jgi:hypothetical protein
MGKRVILLSCFALLTSVSWGQKKVTVSGYIKEASSGETLLGASLYVDEVQDGAQANTYGFYSFSAVPGKYTLKYTYMGMKDEVFTVNLTKDTVINLEMISAADNELSEVVVTAEKADRNVSGTQTSRSIW